MKTDGYEYWRAALAGNTKDTNVHVSEPQPGFYAASIGREQRERIGKPRYAVAIWQDVTGEMKAIRSLGPNDTRPIDPLDVWSWCAFSPITEEKYRAIAERGERWPDEIEPLPKSNNPPADEIEADEIASVIAAALAELGTGIKDQAHSDRIGNHRDRLLKLHKRIDGERKEAKQPHLDAAAAIEEAFKPKLAKIAETGTKIRAALTAWLTAEDNRRQAEARAQIAAEEEARRKAIQANAPPPEPIPVPTVERPKSGTAGRATSLRTQKSAVIINYARALEHFAEHEQVKALIQTLADRAARVGVPSPGCEIKETKVAA